MVTTRSDSEKFYKMVDELESKKVPIDLEEQIRILTFRNETLHKQNEKGPNDLEEQIRILTFRNEKLHLHNEKIEQQIIEVREDNKKLAKQVDDYILKLREIGVI